MSGVNCLKKVWKKSTVSYNIALREAAAIILVVVDLEGPRGGSGDTCAIHFQRLQVARNVVVTSTAGFIIIAPCSSKSKK